MNLVFVWQNPGMPPQRNASLKGSAKQFSVALRDAYGCAVDGDRFTSDIS